MMEYNHTCKRPADNKTQGRVCCLTGVLKRQHEEVDSQPAACFSEGSDMNVTREKFIPSLCERWVKQAGLTINSLMPT